MGILEVPPGSKMNTHRHEDPEVYFIYDGTGEVYIDNVVHEVCAGSGIFLPSNVLDGVKNQTLETLKLMWMFAGNSFSAINYRSEPVEF